MPPLVQGGGGTSVGGSSGASATPIGSPSAGGTGTGVPPTGGGAGGGGSVVPGAPNCPTYDGDFLPNVHAPVCSKCHGAQSKLPDWGTYSVAKASCAGIGSRVASGSMPPRNSGLTLTAEQRSLVADWVCLGCPQAESDLPASCFPRRRRAPAEPDESAAAGRGRNRLRIRRRARVGTANPPQGAAARSCLPGSGEPE
jgi:hypothetical protein